MLAKGLSARSSPEVLAFDVIAFRALVVVMVHVLLNGIPRRQSHNDLCSPERRVGAWIRSTWQRDKPPS